MEGLEQALAGGGTFPLAIALIGIEAVVLRVLGERDLRGSRTSALSGLLSFGFQAVAGALVYAQILDAAYARRVWSPAPGWPQVLIAFVAYDFSFWVGHVAGHRVRLLWCFHATHHTAEQMRLVSAVRGSALDFLYLPWSFAWIPVLGVPPATLLAVEACARLWGVLTHVSPRLVGKLGPLEGLVVTPSAHRVHHGREEAYLDRNYAETLVVWDRLFGTWQPEGAPPSYGLVKPIDGGSLEQAQGSEWVSLWRDLRRTRRWRDRVRYLLLAPGWSHDGPDRRVSTHRRSARAAPVA